MHETKELVSFLKGEPWHSLYFTAPDEALKALGMLAWAERVMLSWLTEVLYRGEGEIVELGVFLGSSSVSLCSGLERNGVIPAEQKRGRIHAFDLFKGNYEQNWIAINTKLEADSDGGFLNAYKQQISKHAEYVQINQGDLHSKEWNGKPIEILFVDVLKSQSLTDKVVREFFPSLVPGRSVIIMQDYLFHMLPYSVVIMEYFSEYFERVADTGRNSVLFVCHKEIPLSMAKEFSWNLLPLSLRLHYLFQALPKQRTHIQREFVARQISDFLSGKYT